MSHTERHTALAWADSIDAERRATQRGATWAEVDAAIRAHMTHDAGCLADIGTESLCEQALMPTLPPGLNAPAAVSTNAHAEPAVDDGLPSAATLLLLAVAGVAIGIAIGWFLPMGFAG